MIVVFGAGTNQWKAPTQRFSLNLQPLHFHLTDQVNYCILSLGIDFLVECFYT